MKEYKRVLTIAGSDPSGGAGVQADIKTISACGCYASSAIVAVVDENTVSVKGVHPVPTEFVVGQIRSVLDDIGTDAVKIGMLHSSELIVAVAEELRRYGQTNIVLDPVMVATSGDDLLREDAVSTLGEVLIPMARVITPNLPEAERLLGTRLTSSAQFAEAAEALSCQGRISVLIKGGHLDEGDVLRDVLFDAEQGKILNFSSPRVATRNTHGTGCTLSSAIASFLARGGSVESAVSSGRDYLWGAIRSGAEYSIGKGCGPVCHFYQMWE